MSARIFIVDTDTAWLDKIKEKMEKEEFEIYTATNCADAKEIININTRPDIFIVSTTLPDGDGVSLCKSIRGDTRLKDVPILITKDPSTAEEEYRKIGINDFITKPVVLSEILKKCLLLIKYGRTTNVPKKSKIGMEIIAVLVVLLAIVVMGMLLIGSNKISGH